MNLSAPTTVVFIIAVVLALIAILMMLSVVSFIPIPAFWVMTIAFGLLMLANLLPGL